MGFFHTAPPPQTHPSAATFSSAANGSNSNKKNPKKKTALTQKVCFVSRKQKQTVEKV